MKLKGLKVVSRLTFYVLVICAAVGLSGAVQQPQQAVAEPALITADDAINMPDVFLGMFCRSDADRTNQIVSSIDGVNFELVNSILKDAHPYDTNDDGSVVDDNGVDLSIPVEQTFDRPYALNTHWCPSFMYYDGYFWSIVNASWNKAAGDMTAEFSIIYSKDLIHWSDSQVCYASLPEDTPRDRFWGDDWTSCVAADFAVAPDNTPYIVMSVGTFGAFSGHPEDDTCRPLLFKVTEMKPLADPAVDPRGYNLDFSADEATWINLPSSGTDFIDGSLYFDGDTCYLSMKENGQWPKVWTCGSYKNLANSADAGVWSFCSDAQFANEAQSMTKYGNTYYMFTDKIANSTNHYQSGTVVQTSSSPSAGWSSPQEIRVTDVHGNVISEDSRGDAFDGPRHGTVITVSDPVAKAAVYNARARMGLGSWVWDSSVNSWRYLFPDGSYASNGWGFYSGHWEYFTWDGRALFDTWQFIDGEWYYFNSSCYMITSCWMWIGDAWYGFWANGAMCRGWVWDANYNSYFYCDSSSGWMHMCRWSWIDDAWYGFWANGTMCRGWVWDSGYNAWFYCYDNGAVARNTWVGDYWLDDAGIWSYTFTE